MHQAQLGRCAVPLRQPGPCEACRPAGRSLLAASAAEPSCSAAQAAAACLQPPSLPPGVAQPSLLIACACCLQLGSAPGTTAEQIRSAKAEFEQQYAQLPSPQWRLLGEAQRSADVVLHALEDRQRRSEAAEADRRLQQVRGSE